MTFRSPRPTPDRAPQGMAPSNRWYAGVSGYEWLVLAIASAGWVFDAFEGQIFAITRSDMLSQLLGVGVHDPDVKKWGDIFLGLFLVGGTLGGIFFGSLADRIGRRPAMTLTILFYSVFSGLTYFVSGLWQVAVLRFFVAMGVGGEWAVAAALVAEVFPQRARANASGIFHATSILGIWLAALAGVLVGTHWRIAYLISVAPALLTLWVRMGIREPESWKQAAATSKQRLGSLKDLLGDPLWRRRAIFGMLLASVGLGTYWSVNVAGQDLASDMLRREEAAGAVQASQDAEAPSFFRNPKVAYGLIQAVGGGLGMLSFGPICSRIGRRRTFFFSLLASAIVVPITCYLPQNWWQLMALLPAYGYFTQAMHAGFAVYFPELFPSHLRATGSGFCFNGGRFLAAPMLLLSGWLKSQPYLDLRLAITLCSLLFIVGMVFLLFLPETKGRPLPGTPAAEPALAGDSQDPSLQTR